MPIIYYAAMAVAALVLLVLFIRSELKLNMCYVLVYATVVIANWGYLALASSDVMEEALLANKIAYIGGCLLPFLMFLAVADLCNIRIPNLLTGALLFLDIVLLFCAFTAGHNELFFGELLRNVLSDQGIRTVTYGIYLVLGGIYGCHYGAGCLFPVPQGACFL